jgi:hypothetical protein
MNVVRFREIIACIIAACSVYACATGSTSPGGGGGGEGGDSWGGPATGPSSSASGSSGSSSGSSGSTVCDMTTADCTACVTCSRESADGICVDVFNDCLNDTNCVDFASCINTCADGDTVCTTGCEDAYPTGVPIFDTYASCVICQDCFVKCDGASACM